MSFDDRTMEYHLTPNGWVTGTYKYYGNVQGEAVPRPSEAIETWEERCIQKSGWSPEEDCKSREIWHDPRLE